MPGNTWRRALQAEEQHVQESCGGGSVALGNGRQAGAAFTATEGKEAQEALKGKQADQVGFGGMMVTIPQSRKGPPMGFKEEHRGTTTHLHFRKKGFGFSVRGRWRETVSPARR